jgi:hypothetical protein
MCCGSIEIVELYGLSVPNNLTNYTVHIDGLFAAPGGSLSIYVIMGAILRQWHVLRVTGDSIKELLIISIRPMKVSKGK